jgi:hypothetical protein
VSSGSVRYEKLQLYQVEANNRLGKWMSAALDDPSVCEAMKADIRFWFDSWSPAADDVRGILKR